MVSLKSLPPPPVICYLYLIIARKYYGRDSFVRSVDNYITDGEFRQERMGGGDMATWAIPILRDML